MHIWMHMQNNTAVCRSLKLNQKNYRYLKQWLPNRFLLRAISSFSMVGTPMIKVLLQILSDRPVQDSAWSVTYSKGFQKPLGSLQKEPETISSSWKWLPGLQLWVTSTKHFMEWVTGPMWCRSGLQVLPECFGVEHWAWGYNILHFRSQPTGWSKPTVWKMLT